jgi:DNA-binding winged helix-turn-helix (wHTH) protein
LIFPLGFIDFPRERAVDAPKACLGREILIYSFEDFELDPDQRELRRGPAIVSVEPQVFDLLLHLVRNRERVVSKEDLRVAVWEGRIVSESTLGSRINAARSVVGDNGEDQRLIRTLPRKGFRFVGPVAEKQELAAPIETKAVPAALRSPEQPKGDRPGETLSLPAPARAGAIGPGDLFRTIGTAVLQRRRWAIGSIVLLVLPLGAAIIWTTTPAPRYPMPQPDADGLQESLMRRVLSATLSGKITPSDEGRRNYYRESPPQKTLAACIDWAKSSPFRLEYRTFGFSQNNRRQQDADERALSYCHRTRPEGAVCDCVVVDRNDQNALTLPPGWPKTGADQSFAQ